MKKKIAIAVIVLILLIAAIFGLRGCNKEEINTEEINDPQVQISKDIETKTEELSEYVDMDKEELKELLSEDLTDEQKEVTYIGTSNMLNKLNNSINHSPSGVAPIVYMRLHPFPYKQPKPKNRCYPNQQKEYIINSCIQIKKVLYLKYKKVLPQCEVRRLALKF